MAGPESLTQNGVAEWTFHAARAVDNPFQDVDLDVVFTDPDGNEKAVPAFWSGGDTWHVRYSSAVPGRHTFHTVCSDPDDEGLHGRSGELRVDAYCGDNPLLLRGGPMVGPLRRCLVHADGTPFFMLADTWWSCLTDRIGWPDDFKTLVADRREKGFNAVGIHVMGWSRGGAAAWAEPYSQISTEFFDTADLRIAHLVENGIVPMLVGCWGGTLQRIGEPALLRYWRYLIARYAAYPVIWCGAGEATIPPRDHPIFDLFMDHLGPRALSEQEQRRLDEWLAQVKQSWGNVIRYVRRADPFGRPTTNHTPCMYDSRDMVDDPSLIDLNLPQCSHDDMLAVPNAVKMIARGVRREPRCPSMVGEAAYEGIKGGCGANVQRLLFWLTVLSGAAGYVYGADGVWQAGVPGGSSGGDWGTASWKRGYRLPGSNQLGIAKRLLERCPWWEFEPRPDWVSPCSTPEDAIKPAAAGIPRQVRVIFFPAIGNHYRRPDGRIQFIYTPAYRRSLRLMGLEDGVRYRALYVSAVTGDEVDAGMVKSDGTGECPAPQAPDWGDWVLVLQAV